MRSIRAFVLALSIHLCLAGWVWWIQNPQEKSRRYQEPPRLLLTFDRVHAPSPSPTIASTPVKKSQKVESLPSVPRADETPLAPSPLEEAVEPSDRIQRLIDRHYGELFEDLSPAEQHYIISHILTIHRIDRRVGNTLLADKPRHTFQDGESNFVEMILHPDGTVSDITIISATSNPALDELTMETVEKSYSQYPRPAQPTLIRLHTRIMKGKY